MHIGVALRAGKPAAFRTAQMQERCALLRQVGNRASGGQGRALAASTSKCSAAAFEYNARCSESQCMAVPGGRRFGVRAWHWQLAAQQEGAGENRGPHLETPAKKEQLQGKETFRNTSEEKAVPQKATLRNTSEERAKKKHGGRKRPPPPLQERARAGKDSAVAPKHGLSWTPIGTGEERYAAVALKNQAMGILHSARIRLL